MMKEDAKQIIEKSIKDMLPDSAVEQALKGVSFSGNLYVAAFGKAGWQMAYAASQILKNQIKKGVVVTKYGHAKGKIPSFQIIEAGHPIPDENSIKGSEMVMDLMREAGCQDTIILLVSGGGSALLEKPENGLTLKDIQEVTENLLQCGTAIQEMNVLRKRLSAVKGGKLAKLCPNTEIYQIVLSDIIDDNLEMIASGPACADTSTYADVCRIKEKYNLKFSEAVEAALRKETPRNVNNVKSIITGSVRELCRSAARHASELGYKPYIVTTSMDCEAKEAGAFLASMARSIESVDFCMSKPCAIIAGGETVVNLTGHGVGGRNQELALSAARGIDGMDNIIIFSLGSDGTDGPTDAAGGIVDGNTITELRALGINCEDVLKENDSYSALRAVNSLIVTGATGTNVNDVAVVLSR